MLRLSKISRVAGFLHKTEQHAVPLAFITRQQQRPYSSNSDDWTVHWNEAQSAYISNLLQVARSKDAVNAVAQLGDEKSRQFHNLLDELSPRGAKDNLSIGRILSFLTENNINLGSTEVIQDTYNQEEPGIDQFSEKEFHGEDHPHAWPDLMSYDPLYDSGEVLELPPHRSRFHNRVTLRNHESMFHEQLLYDQTDAIAGKDEGERSIEAELSEDDGDNMQLDDDERPRKRSNARKRSNEDDDEDADANDDENFPVDAEHGFEATESDLVNPIPEVGTRTGVTRDFANEIVRSSNFHYYRIFRQVRHQTGKGKVSQQQTWIILGNGNGLVGVGMATGSDPTFIEAKATAQAIRQLDFVERFEKRTIWTTMEAKFGSTKIIMRPRPLGFGLRCGPTLHRIFKAAGISDISARVWRSRNPIVVTQAAVKMLHAGHSPLGKGDGAGGPGKRLEKGVGLRSSNTISRARGRYIEPLRK